MMVIEHSDPLFMNCLKDRHKPDLVQAALDQCRQCQLQMLSMHRIKAATKNACSQSKNSL